MILDGQQPLVIAEVAQSHDGSLGMAHAFIDAVADTGADAIKFQTHIAEAESTPDEPWRVKFSLQDKSRYDYWKRMEFSEEHWLGLKRHADERKLFFISSPFSTEAVEMLKRVRVAAWKIASGEVSNEAMFERIASTSLPVLLSTGMSPLPEIDAAVNSVRAKGLPLAVLQCTSMYPTPPEKVGLNMIPVFKERYGCPVGLSDHSGTIYAGLAATAIGASVIEVHVALSHKMFGPDVPVSLSCKDLKRLVEGVRAIRTMLSHPVDKDEAAQELAAVRGLFMKSLVAKSSLPAGRILEAEDLAMKKPGTGLPVSKLPELVGRRLLHSVVKDQLIRTTDVE